MTTTLAPAPGWYPDPAGLVSLRYFDGTSWTPHTQDSVAAQVPQMTSGWYPDPSGNPSLLRFHDGQVWTHQIAPAPRRAVSVDVARSVSTPAPLVLDEDKEDLPTSFLGRIRISQALVGNVALAAGISLCIYFFFSLGFTNIQTDFEQRQLQEEMAASAPATTTALSPVAETPAPSASAPAETAAPEPVVPVVAPLVLSSEDGAPVGRIKIPALDVDEVIVAGTTVPALKKGPGIWRDGSVPGAPGNATISGHRTTYGGPFRHIDDLKVGDQIIVSMTGHPDAVFEVRGTLIVEPSRIEVTESTPGVRLTLTTCDPVGSDAARLVVQAELVDGTYVDQALPADQWKVQS